MNVIFTCAADGNGDTGGVGGPLYIAPRDFYTRFGLKLDAKLLGVDVKDKSGNLIVAVNVRGNTTIDTDSGAALLPISDAIQLVQAIHGIHPLIIYHVMYRDEGK